MAAGLITHNIVTAPTLGTFTFKSWVPDTGSIDANAVPIAMLTDGTAVVGIGTGGKANALRVNVANDGDVLTVAQGTSVGGPWSIEGPTSISTKPVLTQIVASQLGSLGQTTSALSVPVVQANDYGVPLATDKMFAGITSLTPKFAIINASASGAANSIVTGVVGKKIRVLAAKTIASAAVNIKWQSGATADRTGLSYFAALGDGEVLPFCPVGWFETAVGDALSLNLSAAVTIGGHVTYIEV